MGKDEASVSRTELLHTVLETVAQKAGPRAFRKENHSLWYCPPSHSIVSFGLTYRGKILLRSAPNFVGAYPCC